MVRRGPSEAAGVSSADAESCRVSKLHKLGFCLAQGCVACDPIVNTCKVTCLLPIWDAMHGRVVQVSFLDFFVGPEAHVALGLCLLELACLSCPGTP